MENEGKPVTVTNTVAPNPNNGGQINYTAPVPGYGAAQPGSVYGPNQPAPMYAPNQPAPYYDPNQPPPYYDPNAQMMAPPVGTYPGAPGYVAPVPSPYGGMQPMQPMQPAPGMMVPVAPLPAPVMGAPVMNSPEQQAARTVANSKDPAMVTCPHCHEQSITSVNRETNQNQINGMIAL